MSEYYAAKWNDHIIVIVNESDREKLIVDNEILVQTKSGLRFGSALTAPMPGTDGLFIYAMLDGRTCSCIIGRPLDTEYDKKTKTYTAEYNGHTIEAVNKLKSALIVDGVEVDRQEDSLSSFGIRGSQPDENGKRFMSIHDGITNGLKVKCSIYADAENIRVVLCKKQGGELIPLTRNGSSDDSFLTGILIGMIIG